MDLQKILSFVHRCNLSVDDGLRLQHALPNWTEYNPWFIFDHQIITEKRDGNTLLITSCVTVRMKKTMKLIRRDYKKISLERFHEMISRQNETEIKYGN